MYVFEAFTSATNPACCILLSSVLLMLDEGNFLRDTSCRLAEGSPQKWSQYQVVREEACLARLQDAAQLYGQFIKFVFQSVDSLPTLFLI